MSWVAVLRGGETDEGLHAAARIEAHAAAVAVVPGRPAAPAVLDVLRHPDETLHIGARHAALHRPERLVGGPRLWLAVARHRRRRRLARLGGGGERRVALLELREERF